MAERDSPARRAIPWQVILAGIAGLALALLVGTQVIGVLYSIIAPPLPPLPEGATPLEHTSAAYGVDEWLYGTEQAACDVARFYQNHETDCHFAAEDCAGGTASSASGDMGQATQCVGERQFSIFAMRWNVIIAGGYQQGGRTHFRLTREVFWTGGLPPRPRLQP